MPGKETTKVKSRNKVTVFLIGMILLLSLIGCSNKSSEPKNEPYAKKEEPNQTENVRKDDEDKQIHVKAADQEKTLRVTYYLEEQFMREFGNAYKKKFPNTKLQVIPSLIFEGGITTSVETEDLLEQKPDVIFGRILATELSQSRQLLDLTPYMRQYGLELEQFAKPAIEWLENFGMGQLTALSPSFNSQGLYYNKTLFDELNIPYPSNDLSWEHLVQLAEEISRKDIERTVYGFHMDESADRTLSSLVAGLGVENISEDRRISLYYSDDHRTAFSRIVEAFRMNAIYLPPEQKERAPTKQDMMLQNMFIAGEAAMTIRHPGLINDIVWSASQGIASFDWDISPVPTEPFHPGQTTRVSISDTFSIYSKAENKEAAWEFIQFVIGPEMAAELVNTKPGVLSIRMDVNQERHGRKLDAFFAHRPFSSNHVIPMPQEAGQRISPIIEKTYLDILYGRTSISNGLEALQSQVQHILDEAWAK